MSTKPEYKVVILLPVLNEGVWLARCLTSLVNQSQKDIAILVQENCSDDETLEIISDFIHNHTNIFLFSNSSRIDSWQNWDLLFKNAIEQFDFEYLFWIGGDDYLRELDFIHNLYREGKKSNLPIVSPTIIAIDGESGQRRQSIKFTLNSRLKSLRILKYCLDWQNVNMFHSLFSKELYSQLFTISGNSHTNYIGIDWWIGFSVIRSHRVSSLKNAHFYKSHWPARRYEWNFATEKETNHSRMFLRAKRFMEHIFQDAVVLFEHVLRGRPIRNNLTSYEFLIVINFFLIKSIIRPPFIFGKWIYLKCLSLLGKQFATGPTIH